MSRRNDRFTPPTLLPWSAAHDAEQKLRDWRDAIGESVRLLESRGAGHRKRGRHMHVLESVGLDYPASTSVGRIAGGGLGAPRARRVVIGWPTGMWLHRQIPPQTATPVWIVAHDKCLPNCNNGAGPCGSCCSQLEVPTPFLARDCVSSCSSLHGGHHHYYSPHLTFSHLHLPLYSQFSVAFWAQPLIAMPFILSADPARRPRVLMINPNATEVSHSSFATNARHSPRPSMRPLGPTPSSSTSTLRRRRTRPPQSRVQQTVSCPQLRAWPS